MRRPGTVSRKGAVGRSMASAEAARDNARTLMSVGRVFIGGSISLFAGGQVRQQAVEEGLMRFQHGGLFRLSCEVLAFERIGLVVVEFDGLRVVAEDGLVRAEVGRPAIRCSDNAACGSTSPWSRFFLFRGSSGVRAASWSDTSSPRISGTRLLPSACDGIGRPASSQRVG